MRWFVAVVLVLIAASAAVFAYQQLEIDESEPVAVRRVVKASLRNISTTVLATGTIRPRVGAEVKVGARISGQVTRLYVTVGSQVLEGQIIAELDQAELQARRNQVVASIDLERASNANVVRAAGRSASLHQEALISDEEYDQAKAGVDLAQARIKRAEADLALLDVQIGYTTIRTPIAGVVASVSTQEGESISAGLAAPTFVTIINLAELEAIAFVDETDIGRVAPGLGATLTVDTYPSQEFSGVIRAIAPKAVIQSSVVNYEVSIDLANPDGLLKPDMTTNTTIITENRQALCLPGSAIRRDESGTFVLLARDSASEERREIKLGWRSGPFTEVLAGLSDGDSVYVN
ncbi:MAG: efflux RND transporter periplasmic adaptor subunit [Candidatus Latescibacteria bacterium]|jgi:RND family efflux transporter MFP subunit|nr:efflux RND transporter periplasmic adaptor subunit [Candidatus Latescibacterota bacterium]